MSAGEGPREWESGERSRRAAQARRRAGAQAGMCSIRPYDGRHAVTYRLVNGYPDDDDKDDDNDKRNQAPAVAAAAAAKALALVLADARLSGCCSSCGAGGAVVAVTWSHQAWISLARKYGRHSVNRSTSE